MAGFEVTGSRQAQPQRITAGDMQNAGVFGASNPAMPGPGGDATPDGEPTTGLAGLLAVQRRVGKAKAAAMMQEQGGEGFIVIAQSPAVGLGTRRPGDQPGVQTSEQDRIAESARTWIKLAGQDAAKVEALGPSRVVALSAQKQQTGMYGQEQPLGPHLVLMSTGGTETGAKRVEVFLVEAPDERELRHRVELLELSRSVLDYHVARIAAGREAAKSRWLSGVIESLEASQTVEGFRGSCMAWCNELSSRFSAERVSVGFLRGRYVRVASMSQTEHLNRRMEVVQDISAAMEECIDQDSVVVHPNDPTEPTVTRAAAELSRKHGVAQNAVVASFPLRDRAGEAVGALTLERHPDSPFHTDDLTQLTVLADLMAPRLIEIKQNDAWFGARWAHASRKQLAKFLSPSHTWVKLASIAAIAFICFTIFVHGRDRVEATFAIEPVVSRSVPAPWDGYLLDVHVEPGDEVIEGETILASLEHQDLRNQLAEARAEVARYRTEADIAWREGKQAERQIAQAREREATARVDLLEYRLSRGSLIAPVTGVVTQGDLKKEVGRPVEQGQLLFEVAPIETIRAVMRVPEHRIADISVGMTGELATASHPGEKLPFVIERIYPVAEVVDQRNVYKVRVRLEMPKVEGQTIEQIRADWLRPGVEGVAKTDVGTSPYAELWTRRVINWVRMQLWL